MFYLFGSDDIQNPPGAAVPITIDFIQLLIPLTLRHILKFVAAIWSIRIKELSPPLPPQRQLH